MASEDIRCVARRSLQLRHVDCGSCNACESELTLLFGPDYDAQRQGLDMVASPRHADAITVSGPVTAQMRAALQRTYEAMGEPRAVIALGDCAIDGHVHASGYAAGRGVAAQLPVDLQIPGCPPTPDAILAALLKFLGR